MFKEKPFKHIFSPKNMGQQIYLRIFLPKAIFEMIE